MLDDANILKNRDPQDSLGAILYSVDFLLNEYDTAIVEQYTPSWSRSTPTAIVVAGMGGSGLAARLISSLGLASVPIILIQSYDLPAYVDSTYLVLAMSYSGSTEESLSCAEQAKARDFPLICISQGGELAEFERYIALDAPDIQPRSSVFAMTGCLVQVLAAANCLNEAVDREVIHAELAKAAKQWSAETEQPRNKAKLLAHELLGTAVILQSSDRLAGIGYKWKININEFAKHLAWQAVLPEHNHNEMIAWRGHPVDKPFTVLNIRSRFDDARIVRRLELSEQMLSGQRKAALDVSVEQSSSLVKTNMATQQLGEGLLLVLLGDFTAVYLAILNGNNPSNIDFIEKFKQRLND